MVAKLVKRRKRSRRCVWAKSAKIIARRRGDRSGTSGGSCCRPGFRRSRLTTTDEDFQWWLADTAGTRSCTLRQADLLMLDEPSNHNALAWLEGYLKMWPGTIVVVSHDQTFSDAVATDIVLQRGERLGYFKGNFSQFHATKTEVGFWPMNVVGMPHALWDKGQVARRVGLRSDHKGMKLGLLTTENERNCHEAYHIPISNNAQLQNVATIRIGRSLTKTLPFV